MVFSEPQRKDVEARVAGEHGVERRQVSQRLLHDLAPGVHEDSVNGWHGVAEFVHAAGCDQKAHGVLALGGPVERADDLAQFFHVGLGGFGSGSGFKRGGVLAAQYAVKNTDFEEADELLLVLNLFPRRCCRLRSPARAEHAVAVERHQAGELAGPGRVRRLH